MRSALLGPPSPGALISYAAASSLGLHLWGRSSFLPLLLSERACVLLSPEPLELWTGQLSDLIPPIPFEWPRLVSGFLAGSG